METSEGKRGGGAFQDSATRNRAAKNRRKLRAQPSDPMEMAHLGHWEYDVEQDRFTFNDQFYKIFRTTAEQAGGYFMTSEEYAKRFVHPDDNEMVRK
ncbi:MAG: hypothetical protein P8X96_01095, partial [Desulfobacteraceae bacterium]